MDLILTWVNNQDDFWRSEYFKYSHSSKKINLARFRDFGLLKYNLRGIAENIDYLDNLFLVVSSESQIPDWINTDTVKVITHNQIIPQELLPTFNSCTIEMFLHNIPGLNEEFIYSNDDFYFINKTKKSDFFIGGNISCNISQCSRDKATNQSRKVNMNCYDYVSKNFDLYTPKGAYFRPPHNSQPMLKSKNQEAYNRFEQDILNSCTMFRSEKNFNQYLYSLYTAFSGKAFIPEYKSKYFDFGLNSLMEIKNGIFSQDYLNICVNDTAKSPYNAGEILDCLFSMKFPNKCKYEK